jgi:hypothetical protein
MDYCTTPTIRNAKQFERSDEVKTNVAPVLNNHTVKTYKMAEIKFW